MTKKEIQERQLQIMARMHEMQDKSREANNGLINFTEAEDIEFRSLVTESAGLSAEIKAMASASEAEQIRSREEKGKELRELIVKCGIEKRAESTTILAFKDSVAGNDNANDALELMKRGDITGMSFAFEDDWEDSENGVSYEKTNDIEDGKEVWLRHVKKITGLYDVAIVTHPAYEQTTVGLREASEAIDKAIEEQLKRECGDKNDKRDDDPDDKGETDEEREAREKAEREANGGETNAEKEAREAQEREANGGETNAEKAAREQREKEEQEARELEEQEQRFRETRAMRLRAQRKRTAEEIESLNY